MSCLALIMYVGFRLQQLDAFDVKRKRISDESLKALRSAKQFRCLLWTLYGILLSMGQAEIHFHKISYRNFISINSKSIIANLWSSCAWFNVLVLFFLDRKADLEPLWTSFFAGTAGVVHLEFARNRCSAVEGFCGLNLYFYWNLQYRGASVVIHKSILRLWIIRRWHFQRSCRVTVIG